jgi:putative glycosyltransferase (TIGR04348 family)
MRILIVTPAPAGSQQGNRITAERWGRLLRSLGHRVLIDTCFDRQDCDILIALHARRSARSVRSFRIARGAAPLVVALTGTDLYPRIEDSPSAMEALELADRLITLHARGPDHVPASYRRKCRVIVQSAVPPARCPRPLSSIFETCLIAHLRPVKDPFRAAAAVTRLPPESRMRIIHFGRALVPGANKRARREMARCPRYRWLGTAPHNATLRRLARSRLLLVTSKLEGGPNVISEAAVSGVPVIASDIPGCRGLLGDSYPGYFPPGDTHALASLLWRAESDPAFYDRLQRLVLRRQPMFAPQREAANWKHVLAELT